MYHTAAGHGSTITDRYCNGLYRPLLRITDSVPTRSRVRPGCYEFIELSRPNICVACEEIVCFVLRINNICVLNRRETFSFNPVLWCVFRYSLTSIIVPLAQPTSHIRIRTREPNRPAKRDVSYQRTSGVARRTLSTSPINTVSAKNVRSYCPSSC